MEWRLLDSGSCDPAWNMAVDEAMLIHCAAGDAPPTVRFYTWEPAAVSLGYFQAVDAEIDREACRRLGVGWVRRPTGGRAVFHGGDLTYSVVAPAGLLPGGVLAAYRLLAEGLHLGLARLGVSADLAGRPGRAGARDGRGRDRGRGRGRDRGRDRGLSVAGAGPCFTAPSWWELTVGGRKLAGSAQARRRGGILQHGSLPLVSDIERFCAVLRLDGREARERVGRALTHNATSLGEILGTPPPAGVVAEALAAGFTVALGASLVPAELSPAEVETARRLVAEKYRFPTQGRREDLPPGTRISGCSLFSQTQLTHNWV